MPKVPLRKPPDNRNRVDRLLDRIKNNRLAAAVIIGALAIGATASVTDSARKIGELLGSLSTKSAAGAWKTEAGNFRPMAGPEFLRLFLQEPVGDQVIGTIQFSGNEESLPRAYPIVEGKRSGKSLALSFDHGGSVRGSVAAELAGSDLRLVVRADGVTAVSATARRIEQSTQLIDGRFGIVYKGKEYPDHRSACVQLLKDLDTPQAYRLSEAPDEYGNVHCAGQLADGKPGFEMFQNGVQRQVICPARSRLALVDGAPAVKAQKACECDGALVAAGSACRAGP